MFRRSCFLILLVTLTSVPILAQLGPAREMMKASLMRPRSVALGDIDSDGDLDVVYTAQGDTNTICYQRNLGQGQWGSREHPDLGWMTGPDDLKLADINGDGHLDIVF